MTTGLVVSATDELVAELEALYLAGWEASGEGWNAEYPGDAHETKGFTDLMRKSCTPIIAKLLAERAELRRVIADVKWRVADTTDQLQATGFDGDRRYGLDEWSGPIKNLNMAIGILEKSLEPSK